VSVGGLLTMYANVSTQLPAINLPTDTEVIIHALTHGRDWPPYHRTAERLRLPQLTADARRSDKGYYFWGVLQLFGSLNEAASILLHTFWRQQFEALGATDQRTEVRREQIKTQLSRRAGKPFDLTDPDHADRLTNLVLQEAAQLRLTVPSLPWARLEADFQQLEDRHWIEHPAHEGVNEAEWRGYHRDSLVSTVQNLCRLQILHQGYEHRCPKCLHRSWVGIDSLSTMIVCEVCKHERPAPVDQPWAFRINGFLREALQRHGIGPLFWALRRFQARNQNSFWFEGPLDICFDQAAAESGRTETDIDLTMIDGGLVRMCEVKQSARHFTDPEGLARVMARLRPDIAMVAVMEAPSRNLQEKFARFSGALAVEGIRAEMLTFDEENDLSHEPYF
jgi:hypothetical protein